MNSSIVRAFWGVHIDLSRVISISEPQFNDIRSPTFRIYIQLMDKPLDVWLDHTDDNSNFDPTYINDLKVALAKSPWPFDKDQYDETVRRWHADFVEKWKNIQSHSN